MHGGENKVQRNDKKNMFEKEVLIDILGDLCSAWYEGNDDVLRYVVNSINNELGHVDYRIANLENPIGDADLKPIIKDGPNLITHNHLAGILINNLNVDAFSLANNHIGDYGSEGIGTTLSCLSDYDKNCFGVEDDSGCYTAHYVTLKGRVFAFLASCENEYGTANRGGKGSAGYKEGAFLSEIASANKKSDYVIVYFHGGIEHYPYPTPEQRDRYRQFVDMGADIVIGSHTHCPQGKELYKGKNIIYSLGNFWFPRKTHVVFQAWNVGYIARIHFNDNVSIEYIPYFFSNDGNEFKAIDRNVFLQYLENISLPITNGQLPDFFHEWCRLNRNNYINKIRPYKDDRLYEAAIKNLFSCESHSEVMREIFNPNNSFYNCNYECESIIKHNMKVRDYLESNNIKNIGTEKDFYLWGCNERAASLIELLKKTSDLHRIGIIDKDAIKQGLSFAEVEVVSPEYAKHHANGAKFIVCVRRELVSSVVSELREMLIDERSIFVVNEKDKCGYTRI